MHKLKFAGIFQTMLIAPVVLSMVLFPAALGFSIVPMPLGGTLQHNPASRPLSFTYSTDAPNDQNWIGIWPASGGGPVDGKRVAEKSSAWDWAPKSNGSLWVWSNIDHLPPGEYSAFLLAKDGYESLAPPVDIVFAGQDHAVYFPVEEMTLQNARELESFSADLSGLLLDGKGNSAADIAFEKVSGDDWITISHDGKISGTPERGRGGTPYDSFAKIRASRPGSTSAAMLRLRVPVRCAEEQLVETLSVMTFNAWEVGEDRWRLHEKQLRLILNANIDIIGLQEATSGDQVARLGKALGWNYWQSSRSVGILSRYPIIQEYGQVDSAGQSPGGGVRISLRGNGSGETAALDFWAAHLYHSPYGPYNFCFDHNTEAQVLANEASSSRAAQMAAMIKSIQSRKPKSANSTDLVILVGDMNAPSHLDWIDDVRGQHCGIGAFSWPTSTIPAEAGLVDSFRSAHPHPSVNPGNTWSPLNPSDPQDRIDFIYGSAQLQVLSSQVLVVGTPMEQDSEWTSDHGAVLTRYRLAPM